MLFRKSLFTASASSDEKLSDETKPMLSAYMPEHVIRTINPSPSIASQKGQELAGNPKAALLFHWKSLRRQVRIRGPVTPVTSEEADEYFASRPKQAQIGAWASKQSQPLESRFAFEQAIAKEGAKYLIGNVPRPPGWSGWRITPQRIEFWHDRPYRLHDRIEFRREAAGSAWSKVRMYP